MAHRTLTLLLVCVALYFVVAERGEGLQPPPSLDGNGHGQTGYRGGAGTFLKRFVPKVGVSADVVDETGLPNARNVSNVVVRQHTDTSTSPLNAATWWLGQFLDHDVTFNKDVGEDLFIDVTGDYHFDPEGEGDFIDVRRADFLYDTLGTRQFVNDVTSFLDLSAVYGASNYRGSFLREYRDGLMRSLQLDVGEFPPYNTHGLPNLGGDSTIDLFATGDFRANENQFLVAIHTLFVRNHNHWARTFKAEHPSWSDDRLFAAARRWNIAEYQSVIYNELLPSILGDGAMPPAAGFSADVDPSVHAEFSAAAWRIGHTLLNELTDIRDPATGALVSQALLNDTFLNLSEVKAHGIDRIILGLTTTRAMDVDRFIVDSVRDNLFLGPGFGVNLDLAAINLLRGREMAIPKFVEMREALGLGAITSFSELSSDAETAAALAEVYTSVEDVDLWLGLISEDKEPGSQFGRTLHRFLVMQYTALRDGDLYYYEYDPNLSHGDREEIRLTTMFDLVTRNTGINAALLPQGRYFMFSQ